MSDRIADDPHAHCNKCRNSRLRLFIPVPKHLDLDYQNVFSRGSLNLGGNTFRIVGSDWYALNAYSKTQSYTVTGAFDIVSVEQGYRILDVLSSLMEFRGRTDNTIAVIAPANADMCYPHQIIISSPDSFR